MCGGIWRACPSSRGRTPCAIAPPSSSGATAAPSPRRLLIALALVAGTIGTAWQARVARQERARAEQRFDEVRQLANASLFDLHDSIRDLPGSTPARQLLVSKGLEYLDRLSRDAGDRPDLKREMAGAYVKVGDVQGRPFNPNLGDTAGARASYDKAVAIYESLGARTSHDASLRRELATAYLRLSEIAGSTGGTAEALTARQDGARPAARSRRDVARRGGGSSDGAAARARHEPLARGRHAVGDRGHQRRARTAAACRRVDGAARGRRRRTTRTTASARDRVFQARQPAREPQLPERRRYRRSAGAAPARGGCLPQGHRRYPSNAAIRRNLAIAESAVSDVLLALNRRDEALAAQQDALATLRGAGCRRSRQRHRPERHRHQRVEDRRDPGRQRPLVGGGQVLRARALDPPGACRVGSGKRLP